MIIIVKSSTRRLLYKTGPGCRPLPIIYHLFWSCHDKCFSCHSLQFYLPIVYCLQKIDVILSIWAALRRKWWWKTGRATPKVDKMGAVYHEVIRNVWSAQERQSMVSLFSLEELHYWWPVELEKLVLKLVVCRILFFRIHHRSYICRPCWSFIYLDV